MEFDAVLLPPRREQSVARGWWPERTINDALDAAVAASPDKVALTAVSSATGQTQRLTYAALADAAERLALGLMRRGVGRGDVVACQLPNGWQFAVTYLACARIGAVLNPLMHIFRERELSFMLRHGEAKVFVVPRQFRGFDHAAMARALQPDLPDLQHVIVVDSKNNSDGLGEDSFDAVLMAGEPAASSDERATMLAARAHPDDIMQLMYTSGTTGEPKGVMHSANTTFSNILAYAERMRLGRDDVILMGSPLAHQTGFMYGLMMPVILGASAVMLDIWDPANAVRLIREQGVTFTMASTPFLSDLTKAVAASGETVPSLRAFLCAGAPIPGPVVEQARSVLGAKIVSAWGMTENGAVTLTRLDDDDVRASTTDGCPLPGVELRVVDAQNDTLPVGETGRLLVRACSNFGGYLKRAQWNATDDQGWFDTGDMAWLDETGYVRIAGRSKDVIIRGGENIPVVEIEALLYRHPAIATVAIVAYPDERLGERACAVVVPRAGESIDLAAVTDFLASHKVARQYWPERIEVRETLPTTPTGKIQKFKLREMLQASRASATEHTP
ncbi:cyclohexanecarboxylate-CoA ligase [Pandoraea apista]|uniref:cyclohexanecarboxylate-CoA ligase n=1 Tax=Pandoraea apista TaxID=93218 RepID=UPI00058AA043|nr:cyclohexanecarboxylate-CoA ligase [Pandoraea apista]AJE97327.1 cyclohexanecarboxylate--CoA ligase [Pandoraea apista]AKH71297.1 cyclohexanecarboxylate--CoA ligase [Pandoraea apista]AKI63569.1 cyclohexanecarboxylate--CoA ligase [Pandoraea apista]ALS67338.1 cyclohexanecarboxylate-CoA ligase [Pandoraea apista]RRW89188.1 cyclohexanecarboxylate-CoA ligase [Pandoraea apista]